MPRQRSEQARQSVLAAMRRALDRQSYSAVTIEGLAAEAGVAKQTIYRWWPSKAQVLGEALLEGELPGSIGALPMTADLEADLRGFLVGMSADQGDAQGLEITRAVIAVTATDPELGLRLNERLAGPLRDWVIERVERARADGEIRPSVQAEVVAEQLIAATNYATLMGHRLNDERAAEIVEMIVWGIRGSGRGDAGSGGLNVADAGVTPSPRH